MGRGNFRRAGAVAAAVVAVIAASVGPVAPAGAVTGGDWPTYQGDLARSGYAESETVITPSSAPSLQPVWSRNAGSAVASQPVVAGGTVFWGSGDGLEHATTLQGTELWATPTGTTSGCGTTAGVASTATVAPLGTSGAVYVGGGDGAMYALDAATGAVIWKHRVATDAGAFLWGSPAVFGGNVYMGLASLNDCPLVRGRVVELSGTTGAQLHVFYTAPAGCLGASVWDAPAISAAAGTLYVATGNAGRCGRTERFAQAIVELRTSDLSPVSSWTVPRTQLVTDSDFGTTPTLFTATVGGAATPLVAAANKNGILYALRQDHLGSGPLWTRRLAAGGVNPVGGDGSISSAAWDGTSVYAAGGTTTIGSTSCAGGVRALDPATGRPRWQVCLSGPVLGAVVAAPGLVAVATSADLVVLGAATGATLWSAHNSAGRSQWMGLSIAAGVLYADNQDGTVGAYAPGS